MKGEITLAIVQIKINSTAYDIGASASNISFNKSGTSLDATNVQSAIVEIDGDINTLDTNKVDKVNGKGLSTNDFADADKTKLNGIETGAQVNTITGVKGSAESAYRVGNVSISKADIGLANVDNTADVNKPISTATQNALNNKVDKVTGKGLSTEDYTTAEKDKLDTVSEYANHVNVTRYVTTGTKIATISCDGIGTDIYASGSSGSGGHTILDNNGDALTQRDEMQFVGTYSEDDSTNEITKVNIVREMTKAEFDLLSDDEKAGIINVTDEPGPASIINGVFIDTDNVIVSSTTWKTSMTYTATEDCFVVIENDAQNGHFKATIDGIEIYDYGTSGQYVSIIQPFAVKMGQVFGATTNQNNTLHYTVYGIQQGSQETTKNEIYSTDERAVGTWVDGSTIYQKTLYKEYAFRGINHFDMVNLEKIISVNGFAKNVAAGNSQYILPHPNESDVRWSANFQNIASTGFDLVLGNNYSTTTSGSYLADIYVTVQYIKSTT